MRKKIALGMILLIMPLFVNAASISISCPKEIEYNDIFTCTITGTSDKVITAIKMDLQYGEGLAFEAFTPNGWNFDCVDDKIGLITADNKIDTFSIGTLKFKNNGGENNSITLNNIVFYDQDDKGINLDSISKTIIIKDSSSNSSQTSSKPSSSSSSSKPSSSSNKDDDVDNNDTGNSSLIDIEISNYQIDFDRNVYEYELYIGDESSLDIELFLEDDSSYSINGNENLVEGSVIEIEIISVDDVVDNYRINIHKDNKNIENNSNGNIKIIFIIVIVVLVLINILRIVLKKKKDIN